MSFSVLVTLLSLLENTPLPWSDAKCQLFLSQTLSPFIFYYQTRKGSALGLSTLLKLTDLKKKKFIWLYLVKPRKCKRSIPPKSHLSPFLAENGPGSSRRYAHHPATSGRDVSVAPPSHPSHLTVRFGNLKMVQPVLLSKEQAGSPLLLARRMRPNHLSRQRTDSRALENS